MLGASSASGALHSGSRAACTFTSTLAVSPGSHVSSAVFGDKAAELMCLLRVKRPVLAARPNSRQLHAAASAGSLLQLSWHMTCESPCMHAGMNNLIIHPCHRNKNNQMAVSAAPHTPLLYFALSPATCHLQCMLQLAPEALAASTASSAKMAPTRSMANAWRALCRPCACQCRCLASACRREFALQRVTPPIALTC